MKWAALAALAGVVGALASVWTRNLPLFLVNIGIILVAGSIIGRWK